MAHRARITHTLMSGGSPQTGRAATLTLRIMRIDGLVYDWDNDEFRTFALADAAEANPDAELDATNDPGTYYWDIGAGTDADDVLSDAFENPGEYRFELRDAGLGYAHSYAVHIRERRLVDQLTGQWWTNKKVLTAGATGNFTIYEDDKTTVLLQKNVKDVSGGAVTLHPGIPASEEPAT